MEQIDFVIIWVDGGDPVWRAEKNRYLREATGKDAGDHRYRDWDNLRYWFRAVEAYAPWVRKVHFVTCGQRPDWLNPSAPKLHLVDHKDFIPAEYLPTFSSHPIELNLHRIEGLAEQFVYFNDDFFLTAPVEPRDFFRGGLPCDCIQEEPYCYTRYEPYINIRINDLVFCSRHFDREERMKAIRRKWFTPVAPRAFARNLLLSRLPGKGFYGFATHHLPQAYCKKNLAAVWELEPALLHETCTHRFRDIRDVSQCVFKFYQLMTGGFAPYNKQKNGHYFSLGKQRETLFQALREKKYKMVCLNDTDVADFETAKQELNAVFEALLPEPSSFER